MSDKKQSKATETVSKSLQMDVDRQTEVADYMRKQMEFISPEKRKRMLKDAIRVLEALYEEQKNNRNNNHRDKRNGKRVQKEAGRRNQTRQAVVRKRMVASR
jgi:hypothetical protein